MPQKETKYTIERLKGGFNRALPLHQYNQLVNFASVKKLLAECPGDYVCYRFYYNRVAVATSEPDINEWLELHGQGPQAPIDTSKVKRNGGLKTASGQNGYSKGFSNDAMVNSHYDSMIAKLITTAQTRQEAINKMKRALDEFVIEGIKTTIPFHRQLMDHPDYVAGNYTTKFMEDFEMKPL
mgnify:CR=1 FL=1